MLIVEKADERKYTLGVVYEPDVKDTQGEFATADDIERAAWDYVARMQNVAKSGAEIISVIAKAQEDNVDAELDVTDLEELAKSIHILDDEHQQLDAPLGTVVESYIAPVDLELNGETVKKGSWLLGVVWNDEMFSKIKKGERTGFSMFGRAQRVVR